MSPQCASSSDTVQEIKYQILQMKMLVVLALLLTLNACQNPSRFQAAQPAVGLTRH
jgi:uncharacterized lipoprotein YajG